MATHSNIETPDLATLMPVKLTTPEITEIMNTWRYTPEESSHLAASSSSMTTSSSCVATPKPVAKAKQPGTLFQSHGFLSHLGQSVQDAASGELPINNEYLSISYLSIFFPSFWVY